VQSGYRQLGHRTYAYRWKGWVIFMRGTDQNRRRCLRLAAQISVRYGRPGKMTTGRGFDLSEHGIGFTGERLFPVGSTLDIEFRIDSPHAEWFRFTGTVRHAEQDRMGLEFVDLGEADKMRILQVIYHELAIRRPV